MKEGVRDVVLLPVSLSCTGLVMLAPCVCVCVAAQSTDSVTLVQVVNTVIL